MTATATEPFMPASVETPSNNQRLFARYLTGALIDLVVLGLFAEYWDKVSVASFTVALLAAILLQILLKVTIAVEHRVAGFFKARPGKPLRMFTMKLPVPVKGSRMWTLEAARELLKSRRRTCSTLSIMKATSGCGV